MVGLWVPRTVSRLLIGALAAFEAVSAVGARKSACSAELLLRHRREHGMIRPWLCG
jgi:hypothetical protein